MKMKAVLRALYPMVRLGLQRQLGVVVVGYCGAQPIRGPCAAAADAYYSVRDEVHILTKKKKMSSAGAPATEATYGGGVVLLQGGETSWRPPP